MGLLFNIFCQIFSQAKSWTPRYLFLGIFLASQGLTACAEPLVWKKQGPAPTAGINVENIPKNEVVGAIHTLLPHPTDNNIIYVGTINGGVWRTDDALNSTPKWTNVTDKIAAKHNTPLSISALAFDPSDTKHQTLMAGMGRISSYLRVGGDRIGPIYSNDGGKNWRVVDDQQTLKGLDVSSVAPLGDILVLSARERPQDWMDVGEPDLSAPPPAGIWRSEDLGKTWQHISGKTDSGLPIGQSFDLTAAPNNPKLLFTNAGTAGIYRSDNAGATWTKVSHAVMDTLIAKGVRNIEIAVGRKNNVFVGVINMEGRLAGIFYSKNGGTDWDELDIPGTTANSIFTGIHPGGQGGIHFSITTDPVNHNMVYLGGDRQPNLREEIRSNRGNYFPNSLGAQHYTGRLFAIDASKPKGQQATHITHTNTTSNSAPHADSRDMAFATPERLLEVNDGGIYLRTIPRENGKAKFKEGDWVSLNGNIMNTEFHSVSWDAVFDTVVGGTQDNGVPQQLVPGNARWNNIRGGDGGVTLVDDKSTPGKSIVYTSWQFLGGFTRFVRDAKTKQTIATQPQLLILPALNPNITFRNFTQFYTPIRLNNAKPTRIILAGKNGIYESLDQANTLLRVGPDIRVQYWRSGGSPMFYGAKDNQDVIYVGAGKLLFVRTDKYPAFLKQAPKYPGKRVIRALTGNPDNSQHALVADTRNIYETKDAGKTWKNIIGNLKQLDPGRIRSIAFIKREGKNSVAVGTDNSVYYGSIADPIKWKKLGEGLPSTKVLDLEYDAADDILLAGTQGRGAWTLKFGK